MERKKQVIYYINKKFTIWAFIISPDDRKYPNSIKLQFSCTNNIVEYKACTYGIEATAEIKIKKLNVYRDSMLIIFQVKREWQNTYEKLRPY